MMNKRLKDYIDNLFAGVSNTTYARELKEEMLMNLNDKYEDLLIEGKSKEEAFMIVTSSIGDIRELLSGLDESAVIITTKDIEKRRKQSALITSIAVAMYILGAAALITLSFFNLEEIGVVALLAIVAGATGLLVYNHNSKPAILKEEDQPNRKNMTLDEKKRATIKESMLGIFWTIIVAIYFFLGFVWGMWAYSWIIFIIAAAVQNVINLVFQLRE